MLEEAKRRGVVEGLANLYDEYWPNPQTAQARYVPYLEGDFWTDEAETIIKGLPEGTPVPILTNSAGGNLDGASARPRPSGKRKTGEAGEAGEADEPERSRPLKRARTKRRLAKGGAPIIGDPLMHKLAAVIDQTKSFFIVAHLRRREFVREMEERQARENAIKAAKKAVQAAATEGRKPDPTDKSLAAQEIAMDETEEGQSSQDCKALDTREAFLSLCQGNNYQFDMLRRAKHSSMMVLYHLCNPDVPKFMTTCSVCFNEIHAGNRYHCDTCTDFNLCQECFSKTPPHEHPLKEHLQAAKESTRSRQEGGSS